VPGGHLMEPGDPPGFLWQPPPAQPPALRISSDRA
jgi:hypothetical protein